MSSAVGASGFKGRPGRHAIHGKDECTSLDAQRILCIHSAALRRVVCFIRAVRSVRVDSDIDDIFRTLAGKEDRTVAWIVRKLIVEALEARKLLKTKTKPAK